MEESDVLDQVPPAYRLRFVEIVELIDVFCDRNLNDEYKTVCRDMAYCMCQEGSPVIRGRASSWACGIVYSAGWVNFLTDRSKSPHMTAEDIAAGFGVSEATMHAKSREVRGGLDLIPLDPDFTIESQLADNPLIWMIEVNGFVIDARVAPREIQEAAFERGLIPFVPDEHE